MLIQPASRRLSTDLRGTGCDLASDRHEVLPHCDTHATKRLRQWLCRRPEGEVREIPVLPGRGAVGGLRPDTPERAEAQLRVSEGMISNESRVREIRTLGSTSGERKRGQGGDWGTGTAAKVVGNSYTLDKRASPHLDRGSRRSNRGLRVASSQDAVSVSDALAFDAPLQRSSARGGPVRGLPEA